MRRSIALVFFLFLSSVSAANTLQNDPVKSSIVKIFTVYRAFSYLEPWNESVERATGSGAVIEGHRILTNAHVRL